MSIYFTHRGDFLKTERFLKKTKTKFASDYLHQILDKYGNEGVNALREYTPKDTGHTAECWSYEILEDANQTRIVWKNSNINKGVPIAIILFYGHGTRNGGYVQGRDYINPALQPIFNKIAEEAWKEIVSA